MLKMGNDDRMRSPPGKNNPSPKIAVEKLPKLGFLLLGAIAFFWGIRWPIPTLCLTGWQLILGSIPVILGALILESISSVSGISWQAGLATAFIILIPIILCNWAWFKVVQLFPTSIAAIGTLAVPVLGVLSSALALGEPIGFQEVIALILLTMALAIVMIQPEGFSRGVR